MIQSRINKRVRVRFETLYPDELAVIDEFKAQLVLSVISKHSDQIVFRIPVTSQVSSKKVAELLSVANKQVAKHDVEWNVAQHLTKPSGECLFATTDQPTDATDHALYFIPKGCPAAMVEEELAVHCGHCNGRGFIFPMLSPAEYKRAGGN